MVGPGKLLKERTNTYGGTGGFNNINRLQLQSAQKRMTLQSTKQAHQFMSPEVINPKSPLSNYYHKDVHKSS